MIFMCVMDYPTDRTKLLEVRQEHRTYLFKLIDDGSLVSGGSFVPEDDGGLFLYEAASLDEARKLVEEDPYRRHGVVTSYKLREYEIHGVNAKLLRVSI